LRAREKKRLKEKEIQEKKRLKEKDLEEK